MESLKAKLNLETARVQWPELARHFAAGKVLRVAAGLDLVEVAAAVAEDRTSQVQAWLASGALAGVTDAEALAWHDAEAVLWAVVVKPFVLVQPAGTNQ